MEQLFKDSRTRLSTLAPTYHTRLAHPVSPPEEPTAVIPHGGVSEEREGQPSRLLGQTRPTATAPHLYSTAAVVGEWRLLLKTDDHRYIDGRPGLSSTQSTMARRLRVQP